MNYFKNAELGKRILFTLFFLCIYRLGHFIPLLGLNINSIAEIFNHILQTQGNTIFDMAGLFSIGSTMGKMTIFAIGIAPYINSAIIAQLLTIFVPKLRHLVNGTEGDRNIYIRCVLVLTIVLSIIQSFLISLWLERLYYFGYSVVDQPGFSFRLITTITLTGSTLLIIWLSELINQKGIGNGVALLILSEVSPNFMRAVSHCWNLVYRKQLDFTTLLFMGIIFIFLIIVAIIFTEARKKIPLSFKNSGSNYKKEDKSIAFLPLRFGLTGTQPLILAHPLIWAHFVIITSIAKTEREFINLFLYVVFIAIFTYLYTLVVFRLRKIARDFRNVGASVLNSNTTILNYLINVRNRNILFTAIFLSIMTLCPIITTKLFDIPYLITDFLGGINLLIIVGAVLNIKESVDFYLVKREQRVEGIYSTFDEIEAALLREFFNNRGIPCLIQSLRFIWGLPIRTNIDRFILYVNKDNLEESKHILDEIQRLSEETKVEIKVPKDQAIIQRQDQNVKVLDLFKEISWPCRGRITKLTIFIFIVFLSLFILISIIDFILLKLILIR